MSEFDFFQISACSISIQSTLSKIVIFPYRNIVRGKIRKSIPYRSKLQIIENPIANIFSPFAKFYMMISPKWAINPLSKHWYQKYRSTDIENWVIVTHQSKHWYQKYITPILRVSNSISNQHYFRCYGLTFVSIYGSYCIPLRITLSPLSPYTLSEVSYMGRSHF